MESAAQILSRFVFPLAIASLLTAPALAQPLPADAKPTCTVPSATFNSWFDAGTASLNGPMKPANSVTFPDIPNCSFYQWSAQMFLWLTGPTTPRFGGTGRVFESPVFFDVSSLDANGRRSFIPHSDNDKSIGSIRTPEPGPNNLPVVRSSTGQLFEVITPPVGSAGKPLLQDGKGTVSEVDRIEVEAPGRASLFDKDGKKIALAASAASLVAPASSSDMAVARRVSVGGISVLLDSAGGIIQTEEGQADREGDPPAVLLAQNGSLVYYITTVNDLFAFMVTGERNGGITPAPAKFPTTQTELDAIMTFATASGRTIAAPEALALELKSSWVEASGLANIDKYITMDATVPTFDKADPKLWKRSGRKTVKLAMVGLHVVGSTKGHPEMIWATFEHVDNMPAGTYSYFDTANTRKVVAQPTSGTWLFSGPNPTATLNTKLAEVDVGNIRATGAGPVAPSDTIRWKSWGAQSGVAPNPLDSDTASNTSIIALNNSVRSQLTAGDIRSNYLLVGATWTKNGEAPNNTNQVGTSVLANGTMETYQQGTTPADRGFNCFACHKSNQTGVSHIYKVLNPLF